MGGGSGERKLEINIPSQQIYAISKGGLIIEGGAMSSEYSISHFMYLLHKFHSYTPSGKKKYSE